MARTSRNTSTLACAPERRSKRFVKEIGAANGSIDNGAGEIPVLWLHPTAVTAENMEEIVIKSGFHTQQEVYK